MRRWKNHTQFMEHDLKFEDFKVECNIRERHCRFCHSKLSIYNLGKYCFIHYVIGQEKEDRAEEIEENRQKVYRATLNKDRYRKLHGILSGVKIERKEFLKEYKKVL